MKLSSRLFHVETSSAEGTPSKGPWPREYSRKGAEVPEKPEKPEPDPLPVQQPYTDPEAPGVVTVPGEPGEYSPLDPDPGGQGEGNPNRPEPSQESV